MKSIIERLFDEYCCNESYMRMEFPLDKKEDELYDKIENSLSEEALKIFEDLYDVVMQTSVEKRIKCFEQGVRVGIKLANGELEKMNF